MNIKNKFFFIALIILFNYLILVCLNFYLTRNFPHDLDVATQKGASMLIEKNKDLNQNFDQSINLPVFPFYYLINDFYRKLSNDNKIIPLSLLPYKSYLKCDEGYGQKVIKTDRYGFENDDNIWNKKEIDVLIIGDSFGNSFCVKKEDTINFNLNKIYTTLNLSLPGNSPIIYSSIFKNFSKIKKFSNIVIIFYSNDNIYENGNIVDEHYFKNNNQYLIKNNESYSVDKKYLDFLNKSETYELKFFKEENKKRASIFRRIQKHFKLERIRYFLNFFFYNFKNKVPYSSKLIIDLVESYCITNICKSYYIYIPHDKTKRKVYLNRIYINKLNTYLTDNYNKNLINTTEDIYSDQKNNFAQEGHHLSPKGYKIVSDIIIKNISQKTE
tara:strand:+ start:937 stop:2091 length:1155 start_codon:yes stop_codon:yes gene_type:complete